MIIVADTSALLAAFDPEDTFFDAASELLRTETMHISPLVMTELDHLTRGDFGYEIAARSSSAPTASSHSTKVTSARSGH